MFGSAVAASMAELPGSRAIVFVVCPDPVEGPPLSCNGPRLIVADCTALSHVPSLSRLELSAMIASWVKAQSAPLRLLAIMLFLIFVVPADR